MTSLARLSRVLSTAWKRSGRRHVLVAPMVLLLATVALAASFLFRVFRDDTGAVQTKSSDPSTLNATNPFFDSSIGTNGQACVTCHQPDQGITITVPAIQDKFEDSEGLDPLFRFNDTQDNPNASPSNEQERRDAYKLFLSLGVVRIGKTVPPAAIRDFAVVAANAETDARFAAPDHFPLTTDPQHPGTPSLSEFRRPLVNVNVNFDSSVLWDGRADISKLDTTPGGQVAGAIQTLLLGAGTDQSVNTAIADFMTGVFTAQVFDNAAGRLDAAGATGGVDNLLALSQSASRPCVFDEDTTPDITPFVEKVASPASCTPVVVGGAIVGGPPTFTLFDAWKNLPSCNGGGNDREGNDRTGNDREGNDCDDERNAARAAIARGQDVFNHTGCVFCHTVPNLGNNALALGAGFRNIGTDSLARLQTVKAAATTPNEQQLVQDMIDRVSQLPLYCLRSTLPGAPPLTGLGAVACGNFAGVPGIPGDAKTTDPGRALVTGKMADVGLFKPPVLRNLSVRKPFFHAGAAADMEHLINFYNLRFGFGLTDQQKADLAKFLLVL